MQRLSYEDPGRTFLKAPAQSIVKILMQGPPEEDFTRISARASHEEFTSAAGIRKRVHAQTQKQGPCISVSDFVYADIH